MAENPKPHGTGYLARLAAHRARSTRRRTTGAEREVRPAFGLRFAPLGNRQLAERLAASPVPAGAGPRMIATTNLDHVVQLSRNAALRAAYRRAWTVTADGMPVYLYARLRGAPLPGRLTGADVFARLMTMLEPGAHRCFFVAASQDTADRIATALIQRGFARDALAFRVPPHGFEHDAAYSDDLARAIRAHGTTHLFLGLGSPKSEIWADRHRGALGDCYVLNVGAALEFYAGTKQRAPVALQRAGLEWAWRVGCEPRRLFRRYFVDSWRFLWLVGVDLVRPARLVPADPMPRSQNRHDHR
jgi:N-acetylglucosaminyldiphosphoundecaprenol N-acetyl-beta-D-mannosaminyltransferase